MKFYLLMIGTNMKKIIKNEGKVAALIIIAGIIFSFGVFFVSHNAHAIMQAQMQDRMEDPYDGGGGGGGGGYTPPPPPPPQPTNPNLPSGCSTLSSHGIPMACDPANWPKLGETKKLAWCVNDSTHEYRTECSGTTLKLQEYHAETRETVPCGGGTGAASQSTTRLQELNEDGTTAVDSREGTGSCTKITPAEWKDVREQPNGCAYSQPNACGQTTLGKVGTTLNPPIVAVPNFGQPCKSQVNACGEATAGTIGCDGTCTAKTAPANPANYGATCTSPANKCGDTVQGTTLCDGTCSVKSAPSGCADDYAKACTSSANVCGMTSAGQIGRDGKCNASRPSDSLCQKCTPTNACGQSNSGYIVNGTCSVSAPANPANYGSACSSAANNCGMTASGMIGCDGKCTAQAPANSLCPQPCTSAANACGQTTTGMTNNGVCQAGVPTNPTVYNVTGKCTPPTCTVNENLNLTTFKCDPIVCKANQVLKSGKCEDVVCKSNEMLVGNVCQPKPAPSNGACSTTVVNTCASGAFMDRDDTAAQNLWTCKGTSVTYTDNGVSKTDRGVDADCAINKIIAKTPTVSVNPPATSFDGSGITTFNWNVQDATECKLYKDGNYLKDVSLSGSYTSGAIASSAGFEVNCTNRIGEAPYPTGRGNHNVSIRAIPPKPPLLTVVEQPRGGMSVAFGDMVVQPLTIRNDGELRLDGKVYLQNDANKTFNFAEQGNDLNFSLSAGQTRTYSFKYVPRKLDLHDNRVGMNKKANLAAIGSLKVEDKVDIVIESNAGNDSRKVLNVNQTGVDAVSGPTSLNVGDVPAGVNRVFKYNVKNNTTDTDVDACLKKKGADKIFGLKSDTLRINRGQTGTFDISFTPAEFVKEYTDSYDVGILEAGACKSIYTLNLSGRGVKPIGEFKER